MMKNKSIFFIVISIITFVTIEGCASVKPVESPSFSPDIFGTWERADQSMGWHTLTFTSTTLKASNQSGYWNLKSISDDVYYIGVGEGADELMGTIHLTLKGDYLNIIDAYDMQNSDVWSGTEDDWTGAWKRK